MTPPNEFTADLRLHGDMPGAWYFITLPADIADEIAARAAGQRRGFGPVRVRVTVGVTTWETFGASPALHEVDGELRVSALQKAGVFHSVNAASMAPEWRFFVGPGGAFQDSGTAALTGGRIVVGATPNLLFGLDVRRWTGLR